MFTLDTFYKSDEWRNLRELLMLERVNEHGQIICEHCGEPILKPYDCIGHHVIELTDDNVNDYNISLNKQNIKLIHFKCHNLIHERFEGFKQNVYLVFGSPCSGKTTYVKEVANKDDLIIDLDSIWECICTSDRYHKPNRLKANAFGVRDCLIDQVRTRKGKWRNCYLIGTYALKSDRERICDLLGAKTIYIESTLKECLDRAENEEWKDYIYEWFENFTE